MTKSKNGNERFDSLALPHACLSNALQLELRDENHRYRTYLEQRKLDEQKQQIELDRILQLELDRQNAKRVEKSRAEQGKRAKLLQEVIEGRQQQLVERRKIECPCR